MNRDELIEFLQQQPDDIQIFMAAEKDINCLNIKVFLEPKSDEFLKEYFGL